MSEVYYHNHLKNGDLVRKVYKAFNFNADATYNGHQQIDIKRDDNLFSVMVRTDEQTREFILEAAGKTQFVETWPNFNPYEIGSKITSFIFPELGAAEKREAAEMTFVRKQDDIEWLHGPKADKIQKIHEHMVKNVLPLLRDYWVDTKSLPQNAEGLLHKYRLEEETVGSKLEVPNDPYKFKRRSGPANDLL